MTNPIYGFAFVLYKFFVRPFRRTSGRWSAIIFNDEGRFALEQRSAGCRLPSGPVEPGYSIPYLCCRGLGLDQSCFADSGELRLIGIEGRGGEEFVFYYFGEVVRDLPPVHRFEARMSYVDKSQLETFAPRDIAVKLRTMAA
jgi:hypothetical protein